jgi:hypothetical protein
VRVYPDIKKASFLKGGLKLNSHALNGSKGRLPGSKKQTGLCN